jgi:DnaJ-domain-containing protein 1
MGGVVVALMRVLAIAAVVFLITRWLRRSLSGPQRTSPSGKPWWDSATKTGGNVKPKLTTLKFHRNPHEVLGLERDASPEAIEAAYNELLAQNSPETVADMSDDIQAVARRNTDEIIEAFTALSKDKD